MPQLTKKQLIENNIDLILQRLNKLDDKRLARENWEQGFLDGVRAAKSEILSFLRENNYYGLDHEII